MALFKRKKEEVKTDEKKEAEKEEPKTALPQGKAVFAYKVIDKPLITERAVDLSHQGRYVFRVFPRANKVEIKKAVEKLYDVKVKEVKITNTPGKNRQVGRFQGFKPGFKKAIVTLEKGQSIEISHT